MKTKNYITVERTYNGYCVVLANVNGKKIRSGETFATKGAAVAKAILVSYKHQIKFRMNEVYADAAG